LERAEIPEKPRKWDVFICHATEDKKEVAKPLYEALVKAGLKVWYDESAIKLGDRLHKSISKGIAESGYGVVILSKHFFSKNWPQVELEGLSAKEHAGKKVILPIWHEVGFDYIEQKSPVLANLHAVSTSEGLDAVVNKILEVAKPKKIEPIEERSEAKKKAKSESYKRRIKSTLLWLQALGEQASPHICEFDFEELKELYIEALDAIAYFKIDDSAHNEGVFDFVENAILERDKQEGPRLFEILLNWYFETATPYCREKILEIIENLTKLSHLKRVVRRTNRTSDFVAEFGRSYSYDMAGITAQILQNIKSLLSETDYKRIVEFSLSNNQIYGSYRAREYLIKILAGCEGTVEKEKLSKLYRLIGA
jgi:hypothetical protein